MKKSYPLGRLVVSQQNEQLPLKVRRQIMRRLIFSGVLALLLTILVTLVLQGRMLQDQLLVRKVIVRGCELTGSRELLAVLDCGRQTPLAGLWWKARSADLSSLRWVSGVQASIGLDRSCTIRATERHPVTKLIAAGEKYWLCDDETLVPLDPVLDKQVLAMTSHIPAVCLTEPVSAGPLKSASYLIAAAAACAHELDNKIVRIDVDHNGEISLTHSCGLPILLGGPDRIEEKIAALPKALRVSDTYRSQLRYIDARDPHVFYEKWKVAPSRKG